jgi:hypothetical protein
MNDDAWLVRELSDSPFGSLAPLTKLGPGDDATDPAEIALDHLQVRIGVRPVAYDLRALYRSAHKKLPDTLAFNQFDPWLIVHTMGAIVQEGSARVEAMGYEAVFGDETEAYTVDLFPQTRFATTVAGRLQGKVQLGIEGNARVDVPELPGPMGIEVLSGGVELTLSSDASLLGLLSFSLLTPVVQAVGRGSPRCQWHFEKHERPLLGDQPMVQTVLVHRFSEQISFKIRGYALVKRRYLSFAVRRETEWIDVVCPLVTRRT